MENRDEGTVRVEAPVRPLRRFDLEFGKGWDPDASMVECPEGDWIKFDELLEVFELLEIEQARSDRYRMVLEGIKARLALTEVPQDQWVKTLHGEIYAIVAYALNRA